MSNFHFIRFMDYEDGKVARVETAGDYELPVNIFIDNASDFSNAEEGPCSIDVCAVGQEFQVYESEELYHAAEPAMAVISLIPMGTFPANPKNTDFEQSPHILFTGKVLDAQRLSEGEENEPNYCVQIETLDMTFRLYCQYDGPIEKGYVIHGVAWLFGDLELPGKEDENGSCDRAI